MRGARARQAKAEQGKQRPRQALPVSCLALPGESLLSIETIKRLFLFIEKERLLSQVRQHRLTIHNKQYTTAFGNRPPHGRPKQFINGRFGQAFHDEKIQPSGVGGLTIQVSPAPHDHTRVVHLYTCICEPTIDTFTNNLKTLKQLMCSSFFFL